MKNILFLFLLSSTFIWGQDTTTKKKSVAISGDDTIYDLIAIEEPASFPGGDAELVNFLGKNITYPNSAKSLGLQGKVFLTFVVDKTGTVTRVELYKGIKVPEKINGKKIKKNKLESYQNAANDLNLEALRVVNIMSKWKPGKQKGKYVSMRYILPIHYKLK